MAANDILRVLYAPQRAFKEIIQNPRYLGPFIVLIIFVAAQIGSTYVVYSRSYIEQTMPAGDQGNVWTENATLWAASPGVAITNNYADLINGSYYGNSSIEFAVNNSTNIQMALKDLGGSVNCGADGFKNISLRVRLVTPDVKPENVTLYLYSLSDLNFFYYDLTSLFYSSAVNVWNNITIPVGSGDWSSSSADAKWENITSLKMGFAWSSNSSIDLRIDGLFFRGAFRDLLEIYGTSNFAYSGVVNAITLFLFLWLLLTGLMYVIIKGLKGNVKLKPLMVAVGFALVAAVIEAIVLIIAYSALFPRTNYPLEYLAGIPGESDAAFQVIMNGWASVSMVDGIVRIATYIWIAVLGGIVTRVITVTAEMPGFGWLKSLLVSAASFSLTFLILTQFVGIAV